MFASFERPFSAILNERAANATAENNLSKKKKEQRTLGPRVATSELMYYYGREGGTYQCSVLVGGIGFAFGGGSLPGM